VKALTAGYTNFGDPSDIPDPMTCCARCLNVDGIALSIGHSKSTLSNIGFGNFTVPNVIDGDSLALHVLLVE